MCKEEKKVICIFYLACYNYGEVHYDRDVS